MKKIVGGDSTYMQTSMHINSFDYDTKCIQTEVKCSN